MLIAAARALGPAVLDYPWGRLDLQLTPDLPGGAVILDLGPVGELSWRLHAAPINLRAGFQIGRNVEALPELSELEGALTALILGKLPWLALTGALLGLMFVRWGRASSFLAAGMGAGVVIALFGLTIGFGFLTFNAAALDDPRYRGPIEDAPRVLRILTSARRHFQDIQRNVGEVVGGLQRIHSQIVAGSAPSPVGSSTRFLVLSDIHNNPLGMVIADELVRRFEVTAVLDGGDFSDQGTELEGELFARFSDLGIPHVIAPGNHEDSAALNRIAEVKDVTVLGADRDFVEIGKISILGDADPMSLSISSDSRSNQAESRYPVLCERLEQRLDETRPEVLLVHNPAMGECASDFAEENGIALAYVWGHLHRQSYREAGSVISLSPGTSGANGVKTTTSAPYGFALLEFDSATRLASVCLFSFDGPNDLRQATCHLRPGAEREASDPG